MTIVVTEKNRELFPPSVRRKARIRIGDELEVNVSGGVITMLPKLPSADDEYTPEQRRIIDARLAKADEDIKAGRVYGPFETHGEMMTFLNRRRSPKARAKRTIKPKAR